MTSVEVIIPVFNDQSRLNRLLESLTEQTLPPSSFSVTIVDNGSDSPVFLPEGLPFHCRLMFCSKHGSYAARNVAWPNTQAPWVAFTDSDCLPEITWLESGLQATRTLVDGQFPRLLAGRIRMVPSSYEVQSPADLLEVNFGMPQKRYVRSGGYGITANLWVETSLLHVLGGFDSLRKSGADRDFCLRAKKLGVSVFYNDKSSVFHSARSREELAVKARRLIGGRIDAAGPKLVWRLVALIMHLKPLIREGWGCLFLSISWSQRLQVLRLMIFLRLVAVHEWCLLVFSSSSVKR